MKEKEAPEKIYLVIDPVWGSMSVNYNRNDINNIEYIREDAFIEKAAEWLKSHVDDYGYTWYNEMEGESGITDKCIEDFKRYMKGE